LPKFIESEEKNIKNIIENYKIKGFYYGSKENIIFNRGKKYL